MQIIRLGIGFADMHHLLLQSLERRVTRARPALLQFSSRLPGSRVLEDRFHAAFGATAVPKGHTERPAYITEFVEEAEASGVVQRAIERAGVRAAQVAPRGNPNMQ